MPEQVKSILDADLASTPIHWNDHSRGYRLRRAYWSKHGIGYMMRQLFRCGRLAGFRLRAIH